MCPADPNSDAAPAGSPAGAPPEFAVRPCPPATKGAGWQAEPEGPKSRAAQVRLFEQCFGQSDAAEVLRWRYDRCPHGDPICLLGYAQDEPVSGYACNPRRMGWSDDPVTVGQTGDVMSHPKARGKGYFSRLDRAAMQAAQARGWPVVFGLPNRQSAHLFIEHLGWRGVGHLQPWTFVLRADDKARAQRLRAGRLAGWMTPWQARLGRRARSNGKSKARAYSSQAIERFDDWVEPLSRAVAERYAWMVRRDADYLNWRFFGGPNAAFEALRIDAANGEAAAFAVIQKPDEATGVGFLVDLVAIEGAQVAALTFALERLDALGASVVRSHAIVGSDWQQFLKAHAFGAPKPADKKWVIAYLHDPQHPLAQAALDPARWFFTDADRDDELVR